ncbi:hypothetical protein U1Q18_012181 [Sarracenia purpurea var. burkii]
MRMEAAMRMEATRSNRWRRHDRTRTTIVGGTDPRRQYAGEGRRRRGCEGEGGWSEESEEEESSETQRG